MALATLAANPTTESPNATIVRPGLIMEPGKPAPPGRLFRVRCTLVGDHVRHFLTAGYLDERAVAQCRAVARKPLPFETVFRLVDERRDPTATGGATFEGTPVQLGDGLVRCTWYAPRLIMTSVELVLALHAETRCTIADVEHGRLVSASELAGLIRPR